VPEHQDPHGRSRLGVPLAVHAYRRSEGSTEKRGGEKGEKKRRKGGSSPSSQTTRHFLSISFDNRRERKGGGGGSFVFFFFFFLRGGFGERKPNRRKNSGVTSQPSSYFFSPFPPPLYSHCSRGAVPLRKGKEGGERKKRREERGRKTERSSYSFASRTFSNLLRCLLSSPLRGERTKEEGGRESETPCASAPAPCDFLRLTSL